MTYRVPIHDTKQETMMMQELSTAKAIALHLLPAVPVFLFYLLAAPFAIGWRYPPEIALIAGFVLIGIPIELGLLLVLGRRLNGRYSLRGVVLFREPVPWWQYAAFFFLLLAVAFTALFATAPITAWLAENLFYWLPVFLRPDAETLLPAFTPSAVLSVLLLRLVFDGLVNPIVEELYFRGYLLPRMESFGPLAPAVNAALFALQHYWQPYNVPLIFCIQLAVVYVVWWKRNIYISMIAHCSGNLIGAVLAIVGFLGNY
jgi:membrane protease YdiL (CAAX protease family)